MGALAHLASVPQSPSPNWASSWGVRARVVWGKYIELSVLTEFSYLLLLIIEM